jgi:hypothetical protein
MDEGLYDRPLQREVRPLQRRWGFGYLEIEGKNWIVAAATPFPRTAKGGVDLLWQNLPGNAETRGGPFANHTIGLCVYSREELQGPPGEKEPTVVVHGIGQALAPTGNHLAVDAQNIPRFRIADPGYLESVGDRRKRLGGVILATQRAAGSNRSRADKEPQGSKPLPMPEERLHDDLANPAPGRRLGVNGSDKLGAFAIRWGQDKRLLVGQVSADPIAWSPWAEFEGIEGLVPHRASIG